MEDEGFVNDEEELEHQRETFIRLPQGHGVGVSDNRKLFPTSISLTFPKIRDSCKVVIGIGSDKEEDRRVPPIPWDLISKEDFTPPKLSWDRVQVPVPFRFQEDHVRIAQPQQKTSPIWPGSHSLFVLDSKSRSDNAVDNSWQWRVEFQTEELHPATKKLFGKMKPVYITRQQFIQNVLHLMAGRPSQVFMLEGKTFVKNPAILVNGLSPSALWNFAEPFIQCGTIVHRFSRLVPITQEETVKGRNANAVFQAFVLFVSNYLSLYQTILMLNATKISTFTQLLVFLKPFQYQWQSLRKVWSKSFETKKSQPDAVEFLAHLNWLLLIENDPFSLGLLKNLWLKCASAYLKYIGDWVFRGVLPTGRTNGFHISQAQGKSYRDRRYWTKQFIQVANVPMFLQDSLLPLFEVGKATSLLKQIQGEIVFGGEMYLETDDVHLTPALSFADVLALHEEWDSKTETDFFSSREIDPDRALSCIYFIDSVADQVERLEKSFTSQEPEEKFDPDKVMTSAPPAYCTELGDVKSMPSLSILLGSQEEEKNQQQVKETSTSVEDVHCLNLFLSRSIEIPLKVFGTFVNKTLLDSFLTNEKLLSHITTLNSFLCLRNGVFGQALTQLLIKTVDDSRSPTTRYDLWKKIDSVLVEAITLSIDLEAEPEYVDNLMISLSEEPREEKVEPKPASSSSSSPYNILNEVKLAYRIGWPLNIIITEEVLRNFERIFIFQMQLLRAETLLGKSYVLLKSTCKGSPEQLFHLNFCRSRLLHFVRSTRNYVNVAVIQSSWSNLCNSISEADSLDKVYDLLVRHIKVITTNCLLGPKAANVLKLLCSQLVMVECFCHGLAEVLSTSPLEGSIPSLDFKRILHKFKAFEEIGNIFLQVACKLAYKGYYPSISHFLEIYDFKRCDNYQGSTPTPTPSTEEK